MLLRESRFWLKKQNMFIKSIPILPLSSPQILSNIQRHDEKDKNRHLNIALT